MGKKLTQEEFIDRAKAVHGDKYDYSQLIYVNNATNTAIICPVHGVFSQAPRRHLLGNGCIKCGGKSKLTVEEFIQKAQKIHGNKYDYTETIYLPTPQKVLIRCPEHGYFKQQAAMHIHGYGCRQCAQQKINSNLIPRKGIYSSEGAFVKAAKKKHPNLCFDSFVYKRMDKKGTVSCPKHGMFLNTPNRILSSQYPCRKCFFETLSIARHPLSYHLDKFLQIHGNKYNYSLIPEHSKVDDKVEIICPTHGPFLQAITQHAAGQGCPHCARVQKGLSWIERANGRASTLYLLRVFSDDECFYKVGVTCKSIADRYKKKQSLSGYQYEVLAQYKSSIVEHVFGWEQSILLTFSHLRYYPKNQFIGHSECFIDATEIIACFPGP